jgi:hypothetical protein
MTKTAVLAVAGGVGVGILVAWLLQPRPTTLSCASPAFAPDPDGACPDGAVMDPSASGCCYDCPKGDVVAIGGTCPNCYQPDPANPGCCEPSPCSSSCLDGTCPSGESCINGVCGCECSSSCPNGLCSDPYYSCCEGSCCNTAGGMCCNEEPGSGCQQCS